MPTRLGSLRGRTSGGKRTTLIVRRHVETETIRTKISQSPFARVAATSCASVGCALGCREPAQDARPQPHQTGKEFICKAK